MRIRLSGDVNLFYVQTLCQMFFPGSKFSEKTQPEPNEPSVFVKTEEKDASFVSTVSISVDGADYVGEYSLSIPPDETGSRSSMAAKISVGKAFLQAADALFGFAPPWGILTGVRPAKLATKNFEMNMTTDECVSALIKDYLVSPSRARLAADVALAERRLITGDARRACSVYIAIPFCPSRCSYCSFVSFTSKKLLSLIPEYISVLERDIADTAETVKSLGLRVSSVYIGGGTPTVLSEAELSRVLSAVAANFDVSSLEEFTLEAGRPDTINPEKLDIAKRFGVSRVSVNTQTLNDSVLESIGRRHTAKDFMRAYSAAAKSGIKDINVDLIAGLPGETFESFKDSLDTVISLAPSNVTVHTFCVKRAADVLREGREVYFSRHETALKSVDYSREALRAAGYFPYYMYRQKNTTGNLENVGYSLSGHEGLYNIYMMEEVHSVFGVGASSVTKLVSPQDNGARIIRLAESKYPYEYLREKNGAGENDRAEDKRRKIFDFYA